MGIHVHGGQGNRLGADTRRGISAPKLLNLQLKVVWYCIYILSINMSSSDFYVCRDLLIVRLVIL